MYKCAASNTKLDFLLVFKNTMHDIAMASLHRQTIHYNCGLQHNIFNTGCHNNACGRLILGQGCWWYLVSFVSLQTLL